jgi:hypothetical protein
MNFQHDLELKIALRKKQSGSISATRKIVSSTLHIRLNSIQRQH